MKPRSRPAPAAAVIRVAGWRVAVFALALLLGGGLAHGDGKFFPPAAFPVNVTIPDQRALIHFSNGVERLVIETRFSTTATNLAWVVPLPAKPVIEEATPGLFPTLDFMFRPEVVHQPARWYLLSLFVGGIVFLFLTVRPTGRLTAGDVAACLAISISMGLGMSVPPLGVVVFLLSLWAIDHCRREDGRLTFFMVTLAIVSLFFGMLLPAASHAKAGIQGNSAAGVNILASQAVGVFDTTTVASRDPEALQSWLTANGFAAPTNARPVIADYVKQGWVFVAAKVRRNDDAPTNSVHPLSFTFATPQAVYPMRLTGVAAERLRVELYVFGPSRAEAPGFAVNRCAGVGYPVPREDGLYRSREPGISVQHPQLRTWTRFAPVATKLTATLTGKALHEDVKLDWVPFAEAQTVLYSHTGALQVVLNWTVTSLVVIALLGGGWWRCGWGHAVLDARGMRLVLIAVAFVIAAGVAMWIALPKTEVRLQRFARIFGNANIRGFLELQLSELSLRDKPTAEQLRATLRNSGDTPRAWRANLILGGLIHEEDSPGNYVVREGTNGVEVLWYDYGGAEHRLDF